MGGSATSSFAFDAADRILSPGYTYDSNGNMTGDGSQEPPDANLTPVATERTETAWNPMTRVRPI